MTESLERIDNVPEHQPSDRVNPADPSNPEKKDNGFSNALKEKMKEKLKKKKRAKRDEVILRSETNVDKQMPAGPAEHTQGESKPDTQSEPVPEETEAEHIDLTA